MTKENKIYNALIFFINLNFFGKLLTCNPLAVINKHCFHPPIHLYQTQNRSSNFLNDHSNKNYIHSREKPHLLEDEIAYKKCTKIYLKIVDTQNTSQ